MADANAKIDYTEMCCCGTPLHYLDPEAERRVRMLVSQLGPTIRVQLAGTNFSVMVPRHYIALHGLAARDLAYLTEFYGWERVPS